VANFKITLTRIHFLLLLIVILNTSISNIISLNYTLFLVVKRCMYLSGIALFFYNVKPFKKLAVYFGMYVFSPVIIFISTLINGFFGIMLATILLTFLMGSNQVYNKHDVKVYTLFQGFLGGCCTYEITESKFFVFEKHVANIYINEDINFENADVTINADSVSILNYKDEAGTSQDTVVAYKRN